MSFACVPVISWWKDYLHVVSIELVTGEQSVAKDAPPTHSSPPGGCHRSKEKLWRPPGASESWNNMICTIYYAGAQSWAPWRWVLFCPQRPANDLQVRKSPLVHTSSNYHPCLLRSMTMIPSALDFWTEPAPGRTTDINIPPEGLASVKVAKIFDVWNICPSYFDIWIEIFVSIDCGLIVDFLVYVYIDQEHIWSIFDTYDIWNVMYKHRYWFFDEKAWLEEKEISYSIMIEDLGP